MFELSGSQAFCSETDRHYVYNTPLSRGGTNEVDCTYVNIVLERCYFINTLKWCKLSIENPLSKRWF